MSLLVIMRGVLGKIRIYLYTAVVIYDLVMRLLLEHMVFWTIWVFSSHVYTRDSTKLFLPC